MRPTPKLQAGLKKCKREKLAGELKKEVEGSSAETQSYEESKYRSIFGEGGKINVTFLSVADLENSEREGGCKEHEI